jgi:predicted membrane-bound mannosyltransferase
VAALVLLVAAAAGLRQSVQLNFDKYDDEAQVYVYAHTRRSFLDMIAAIDRIAALSGQGKKARIEIPAKEHWPLPWYLRRYSGAAYEDVPENARLGVMVIGGLSQEEDLAKSLGAGFDRVGRFALRPGVDLVLFARKDLTAQAAITR